MVILALAPEGERFAGDEMEEARSPAPAMPSGRSPAAAVASRWQGTVEVARATMCGATRSCAAASRSAGQRSRALS